MDEGTKMIITALSSCVSFALGILAVPINSELNIWLTGKRMSRALYIELKIIYSTLYTAEEFKYESSEDYKAMSMHIDSLSLDSFQWAKSKPDVLYSLPDAQGFVDAFGYFKLMNNLDHEDEFLVQSATLVLNNIEDSLTNGKLNDDLFRECYPGYDEHRSKRAERNAKAEEQKKG
jgi:hypothetical protein